MIAIIVWTLYVIKLSNLYKIIVLSIKMYSVQSVEIQSPIQIPIPSNIQCEKQNIASYVCLNLNCSQHVFLCDDKNCLCYKIHKGCIKGSIQSITEALQQKIMSIDPFQNRINYLIQKAIDELSDFRERIIEKAKRDLDYVGLTENQRKFMKAIKRKQSNGITGKEMSEIFSCISNMKGFNNKMEKIQNKITQVWNTLKKSMSTSFSRIQSLLGIFAQQKNSQFNGSLLLKSNDDRKTLTNLFDKKIEFSNLLYRASQNDFGISTFFENCKEISNTLVICETQFGKVIGGFTPIKWVKYSSDSNIEDPSGQSFVFSLTNNDKFKHQSSNCALRYRSGYGPMFGNKSGSDLCITDHADRVRDSFANINNAYINKEYMYGNNDTWEKFSGSKGDYKFYVKQWEVWHVKFE